MADVMTLNISEDEAVGFQASSLAHSLTINGVEYDGTSNVEVNTPAAVTEDVVSGWGFTKNTGTYSKPTGGIPKTDLSQAVQTSLGKADSALQSYTETDPTVPSWAKAENKPTYSYNELTDRPTIPSAVTESTVSGWGFTKNSGTYSKPTGGIPSSDLTQAVQTSLGKADTALQSYTETDPTVPSWAKEDTKPSYDYSEIGNTPSSLKNPNSLTFTGAATGTYDGSSPVSINIPSGGTSVTEETVAGWGFTKNTGTYSKPTGGIPKTDLASAVQTSLGKADTALQSYTETDPTVPSWAKATNKPSYSYTEISGTPTSLKNPNAITFTGASTGTYDGSSALTINIPSGGGSVTPGTGWMYQGIGNSGTSYAVNLPSDWYELFIFVKNGNTNNNHFQFTALKDILTRTGLSSYGLVSGHYSADTSSSRCIVTVTSTTATLSSIYENGTSYRSTSSIYVWYKTAEYESAEGVSF